MKIATTIGLLIGLSFVMTTYAADVQQSGQITPGHPASWTTNGVIQDGGTPQDPKMTGVGVYSTNQQSICANNSKTSPRSQICLGVTATEADLTVQNYGGPELPFYIIINGGKFPFPGSAIPGGQFLFATTYGVVADAVLNASGGLVSGTSNDVAMKAAIDACAAVGATLYLPAGNMLMDGTGATTINVKNCRIAGSGPLAGTGGNAGSSGSTILLTSTTTAPFELQNNWGMSYVNFYYPNQLNGTTVYPALFKSGDGSVSTSNWFLDHVQCVNAYYCWVQTPGGGGIGTGYVSNSSFYAVKAGLQWHTIGNTVHFNNVDWTPGSWWNITGFSAASLAAVDAAVLAGNKRLQATSGGALNITMDNSIMFDWAYAIYQDSGSTISITQITESYDGVGTILDTSAGGLWQGNTFVGAGNCRKQVVSTNPNTYYGNAPCFNLGATGVFESDSLKFGTVNGSFIVTNGSNVTVNNAAATSIGAVADGGDYSAVKITAAGVGINVLVKGASFGGQPSSAHTHGITTGGNVIGRLIVQNADFIYMNDDINIAAAAITTITNNVGSNTNGTVSVAISGTNPVLYANNNWDKPPLATITTPGDCGGTGESVSGAFTGVIFPGSTNPTTSCKIRLPWRPYGSGGGVCQANAAGPVAVGSAVSGLDWTFTAASDVHGSQLFFNCPGQQ